MPHAANLSLVTMCTMHLLTAIPKAGKYLELSIEGDDYYPWQRDLFVGQPFAVTDGHVTVTDTPRLGVEISPAWLDGATYGARTDHLALWDHLMSCGAPHGLELSSARAMTIRRIEGGILGNLSDIDTSMTPFEAGLAPFVDMEKGDFIGRSALVDRDRRPVLFGIKCQTAVPAAGSVILDAGRPVGRVTAGVPSPTLGCGVGYARFSAPGDWIGRSLRLSLPNGETHEGQIIDLPFFDKEKNIVRDIDRHIPARRPAMPFDAR